MQRILRIRLLIPRRIPREIQDWFSLTEILLDFFNSLYSFYYYNFLTLNI